MENKPFDLQSPIKIASEYGGNKQKIAQASKMGLVDPTAALLAGMFIDRMRSAQQAEMTPQQTVADKVFSPQPPPPPPGAMPQGAPPQGGPPQGGPPRGGPPMPTGGAPMPPPPPPQGGPPMGMAGGGLMSIPVPDAMFDEPDNGGYANGGMVAFASAGDVRLKRLKQQYDDAVTNKASAETVNNLARQINNFQQDEGAAPGKGIDLAGIPQTPYFNRLAGAPQVRDALGALGKFASNYNDNPYGVKAPAVDATTPAAAPQAVAPQAAAPAAAPAVIPTAPRTTAAVVAPQMGRRNPKAAAAATTPPKADAAAAAAAPVAPEKTPEEYRTAGIKEFENMAGAAPSKYADMERARQEAVLKGGKDQKKQDMWEALTQFGLNLASNKSPSFLQAVGEAGNATLPSIREAAKERKADELAASKGLAETENKDYDRKLSRLAAGVQMGDKDAMFAWDKAKAAKAEELTRLGWKQDAIRDQIRRDFDLKLEGMRGANAVRVAGITAADRGALTEGQRATLYNQVSDDVDKIALNSVGKNKLTPAQIDTMKMQRYAKAIAAATGGGGGATVQYDAKGNRI